MLGRSVIVPRNPQRIISLVPSQTELLFDLGLAERIAGITWFCIHPAEQVKDMPRIGGTKNLKLDKIRSLNPDLIIANKEENERSQIEGLAKDFPVWVSDISTVDDATEMINRVGELTGTTHAAEQISDKIIDGFANFEKAPSLRTFYLIWKDPYMTVGNDTFIHHILTRMGLQNVCGDQTRYPKLSDEQIKAINPQLILLSSEPFPFTDKHIAELQNLVPSAKILLVDGEMFSWYGSRLIKSADYLKQFVFELRFSE
jgi:ABC-type Fe3+-hydroxamate transport system substrate-binding protein